ncbi:MAG: response regulator [Caldisericales bacterium]|nr:response regulator [bacterium]
MAKILIADEFIEETNIISNIVGWLGHTPVCVRDGEEALSVAKFLLPEIVFLSVTLPKKNGYLVCREMKGDPLTEKVNIVLVDPEDKKSTRFYGTNQGASHVLARPLSGETISRTIRKLLCK